MDLKETILEGTIDIFRTKGIRFTMDDIAKKLNISKKTIYTVFDSKEALFLTMVDYLFDRIKDKKELILKDEKLSTLEKIENVLGAIPECYEDLDFRQLYILRQKYPYIYSKVEERLETGWESTIRLIRQGMEEGCVRQLSIPILKMMLEASVEQFFQRDVLVANGLSYRKALDEVVTILVKGIRQDV